MNVRQPTVIERFIRRPETWTVLSICCITTGLLLNGGTSTKEVPGVLGTLAPVSLALSWRAPEPFHTSLEDGTMVQKGEAIGYSLLREHVLILEQTLDYPSFEAIPDSLWKDLYEMGLFEKSRKPRHRVQSAGKRPSTDRENDSLLPNERRKAMEIQKDELEELRRRYRLTTDLLQRQHLAKQIKDKEKEYAAFQHEISNVREPKTSIGKIPLPAGGTIPIQLVHSRIDSLLRAHEVHAHISGLWVSKNEEGLGPQMGLAEDHGKVYQWQSLSDDTLEIGSGSAFLIHPASKDTFPVRIEPQPDGTTRIQTDVFLPLAGKAEEAWVLIPGNFHPQHRTASWWLWPKQNADN